MTNEECMPLLPLRTGAAQRAMAEYRTSASLVALCRHSFAVLGNLLKSIAHNAVADGCKGGALELHRCSQMFFPLAFPINR